MGKGIAVVIVILGMVLWSQRNSPGLGEWLRRMTDRPTNLALIGTSGFEREGRDPAKPR